MIKSMTGFGRGKISAHQRELTIEIKSVNHRYFDCSMRLPRMYSFLEDPIKSRLQQQITRGKVDVYLSIENAPDASNLSITVHDEILGRYLEVARTIRDTYGLQDDLTVTRAMNLPDVLTVQKQEENADELTADVLAAVDEALCGYREMREREGARLIEDIVYRIALIGDLADQIEKRSPKCVEEYRAKLEARMQEVLESTTIDPQRILTEAAIFADKTAVTEEIVRLRSHLSQLTQMLQTGGAIGRKVDFLVQELNREANTIGSKANDVTMAQLVVDVKAEIEKIREQIQNIE